MFLYIFSRGLEHQGWVWSYGTCLQSVKFFFIRQYMCSHVCQKNPKYTFYTIKSSLTLAYKLNNRLKAQVIDKSYLSLHTQLMKIFLT
jgi:hypothetical protein